MRLVLAALVLALSACAESADEASGERLLAEPPEGWKQVFRTDKPDIRLVEYIPEDQHNASWSSKVSFESLAGNPQDPIDFVNGISADQANTCDGFEATPTFAGLENGYPTTVQFLECANSRLIERSQVTMIKAIQGNDYFYVITRAHRGAPLESGEKSLSNAEIAEWSMYLRAISLCDDRDPEHACPQ